MMTKTLCGCLLALAGLLASPAAAQVIIQPGGLLQNPLLLVENKDAQKDLQLSEEQVKSIAVLSKQQVEGLKGVGHLEVEKRKKVFEATQKGLSEVLTPVQTKRVKQLELQQRGANVFQDPQVVKDLALTREQQAAAVKTVQAVGQKWIAILQAARGNQPEM